MSVRILVGDCREKLRELPDGSVHCCVSSPPYFGLRDYGCAGQMGLEPTPSCNRQGLMRLRGDLTEAQRQFVALRLLGVELPDA